MPKIMYMRAMQKIRRKHPKWGLKRRKNSAYAMAYPGKKRRMK